MKLTLTPFYEENDENPDKLKEGKKLIRESKDVQVELDALLELQKKLITEVDLDNEKAQHALERVESKIKLLRQSEAPLELYMHFFEGVLPQNSKLDPATLATNYREVDRTLSLRVTDAKVQRILRIAESLSEEDMQSILSQFGSGFVKRSQHEPVLREWLADTISRGNEDGLEQITLIVLGRRMESRESELAGLSVELLQAQFESNQKDIQELLISMDPQGGMKKALEISGYSVPTLGFSNVQDTLQKHLLTHGEKSREQKMRELTEQSREISYELDRQQSAQAGHTAQIQSDVVDSLLISHNLASKEYPAEADVSLIRGALLVPYSTWSTELRDAVRSAHKRQKGSDKLDGFTQSEIALISGKKPERVLQSALQDLSNVSAPLDALQQIDAIQRGGSLSMKRVASSQFTETFGFGSELEYVSLTMPDGETRETLVDVGVIERYASLQKEYPNGSIVLIGSPRIVQNGPSTSSVITIDNLAVATRNIGAGRSLDLTTAKGTKRYEESDFKAAEASRDNVSSSLRHLPALQALGTGSSEVMSRFSALESYLRTTRLESKTWLSTGERGEKLQSAVRESRALANELRSTYNSSGLALAYNEISKAVLVLRAHPNRFFSSAFEKELERMEKQLSILQRMIETNAVAELCQSIDSRSNDPDSLWDWLEGDKMVILSASIAAGIAAGMMIPATGGASAAVGASVLRQGIAFVGRNVSIAAGGHVGQEYAQSWVGLANGENLSSWQKISADEMELKDYVVSAASEVTQGAVWSSALMGVGMKVGRWARTTQNTDLVSRAVSGAIKKSADGFSKIDDALNTLTGGARNGASEFAKEFVQELIEEMPETVLSSVAANADAADNPHLARFLRGVAFCAQVIISAEGEPEGDIQAAFMESEYEHHISTPENVSRMQELLGNRYEESMSPSAMLSALLGLDSVTSQQKEVIMKAHFMLSGEYESNFREARYLREFFTKDQVRMLMSKEEGLALCGESAPSPKDVQGKVVQFGGMVPGLHGYTARVIEIGDTSVVLESVDGDKQRTITRREYNRSILYSTIQEEAGSEPDSAEPPPANAITPKNSPEPPKPPPRKKKLKPAEQKPHSQEQQSTTQTISIPEGIPGIPKGDWNILGVDKKNRVVIQHPDGTKKFIPKKQFDDMQKKLTERAKSKPSSTERVVATQLPERIRTYVEDASETSKTDASVISENPKLSEALEMVIADAAITTTVHVDQAIHIEGSKNSDDLVGYSGFGNDKAIDLGIRLVQHLPDFLQECDSIQSNSRDHFVEAIGIGILNSGVARISYDYGDGNYSTTDGRPGCRCRVNIDLPPDKATIVIRALKDNPVGIRIFVQSAAMTTRGRSDYTVPINRILRERGPNYSRPNPNILFWGEIPAEMQPKGETDAVETPPPENENIVQDSSDSEQAKGDTEQEAVSQKAKDTFTPEVLSCVDVVNSVTGKQFGTFAKVSLGWKLNPPKPEVLAAVSEAAQITGFRANAKRKKVLEKSGMDKDGIRKLLEFLNN